MKLNARLVASIWCSFAGGMELEGKWMAPVAQQGQGGIDGDGFGRGPLLISHAVRLAAQQVVKAVVVGRIRVAQHQVGRIACKVHSKGLTQRILVGWQSGIA